MTTTVAVTPDAAATAEGLRELAARVESGELPMQPWGVEILFNPGSRAMVRAEALRLGLLVHEGPGFTSARLRLSAKVAYVLYAQGVTP
jgi:hypothetical protein